jgi:hypothetical protein
MSNKLSPLLSTLETAYELIAEKTGAPKATLVIARKTGNTMGHWTNSAVWVSGENKYNELMISGDYLERTAEELLGTLVHELAHAINSKNSIKDCSSNQYHNKNFKDQAEALGLTVTFVEGRGFSQTKISNEGLIRWAKELDLIHKAKDISAPKQLVMKKGRDTNYKSYKCGCGFVVRMSVITYELSSPKCTVCNTNYERRGL